MAVSKSMMVEAAMGCGASSAVVLALRLPPRTAAFVAFGSSFGGGGAGACGC